MGKYLILTKINFFTNLILPKLFLTVRNRFVCYVAGICHSVWQFIKYFCENVKTATSLHSLLNPTVNLRKPLLKYCCWILQILHIWTNSLKWLIFCFGCFKNKLQSELFLGSTSYTYLPFSAVCLWFDFQGTVSIVSIGQQWLTTLLTLFCILYCHLNCYTKSNIRFSIASSHKYLSGSDTNVTCTCSLHFLLNSVMLWLLDLDLDACVMLL